VQAIPQHLHYTTAGYEMSVSSLHEAWYLLILLK